MTPSDADVVLSRQAITGSSPAERGPYEIETLFYGSGTDKNRAEYRDSVSIVTDSVDASKLVSLGGSASSRNKYWGFTPEGFPLNGRVWYPKGDGPFPLVLVVHGNHNPRDFSDPGYDYLGELLASRGMILVSLDMNFINGGIRQENDGRGWLMLKHIEAFEGFNQDAETPFYGKVDMSRIAIMGHSRGGEAVGHAAAFNRLARYPDDASLEFDFNYDIKSVVAIAPVDGQYLPTGRKVPVENVNYLTFHGSHDGDVTSFHGLRQWDRVDYTAGGDYFKSSVYMYRANHGQWNSVWNSFDGGPRSGRFLDLRYLVPPEDQRRMAEVYVTAFLEATLNGEEKWLPLFRDHRVAGEWLPETMYVTRMQHASYRPLVTFEEDIDVTSGTHPGVTIRGDSLATWKEETLTLRSRNRASTSASQENQAVRLGWNNRIAGPDTTRTGPPAAFEVGLPNGLARSWGLTGDHSLTLSLIATENLPGPRKDPEPEEEGDDEEAGQEEGDGQGERGDRGRGSRPDPDAPKPPVDLSIEVEDASGRTARVPLSRYGAIRRPMEITIWRRTDQESEVFGNDRWEFVLQSFDIPLSDFTQETGGLQLGALTAVRLVFDQAVRGEILLDDIGFARLGDGFWSAR